MHPIEVLGDGLGLIGLDGAYEVPANIQLSVLMNFPQGLLQVTLAKVALAAGVDSADVGRRSGLADG